MAADVKDIVELLERKATKFLGQINSIRLAASKVVGASQPVAVLVDEKVSASFDEKGYHDSLQDYQFQLLPILDGPIQHFDHAAIEASAGKVFPQGRLMRLRKEVTSLMNNLPPGVFVRVDEHRFDVLRAMIIGPADTPYENGCFFFDMFLPPEYPNAPPHVVYTTTGKGTFRFNPNLYANGKVCLSLLGTWSGPGWDPQVSTLLQVLVSIQAMILCDEPYYNEPGWSNDKGTSREYLAHLYHATIRHATMNYAMLDYLLAPPYGFEDAVRTHFKLKKQAICSQIEKWKDLHQKAHADAAAKQNDRSSVYGSEMSIAATFEDITQRLRTALEEQTK